MHSSSSTLKFANDLNHLVRIKNLDLIAWGTERFGIGFMLKNGLTLKICHTLRFTPNVKISPPFVYRTRIQEAATDKPRSLIQFDNIMKMLPMDFPLRPSSGLDWSSAGSMKCSLAALIENLENHAKRSLTQNAWNRPHLLGVKSWEPERRGNEAFWDPRPRLSIQF